MSSLHPDEVYEICEKINKEYNCFVTVVRPEREGDRFFSAKDCLCTKNIRTTAGSRMLENYVPFFDATCVELMKKAGYQLVGKTAMDEFGFGSFTVNTFIVPKNPWDKDRVCGGSSGGAACFTALAPFKHIALAESTGGSIACPASFCGVVGLTPTYGVVSRYGLIDYANSLDKIGVMAKTVDECIEGIKIIGRKDARDSTSVGLRCDLDNLPDARKFKVAVPREYFENVNKDVERCVWNAIHELEKEGIEYNEINLEYTKYALAAYYIIATSEASTNLAKYCGMRYGLQERIEGNFNEYFSRIRAKGFGEEAKRRILLGTYARMSGFRDQYYIRALKVRRLVIDEFKRVLNDYDCIVAPTMPFIAPKFDEVKKLTPVEHYMSDVLTVPVNLAGLPHISIPCGFSSSMPVGMQIISEHFREDKVLALARLYESIRGEIKYPSV